MIERKYPNTVLTLFLQALSAFTGMGDDKMASSPILQQMLSSLGE